jgi:hypothetical protein
MISYKQSKENSMKHMLKKGFLYTIGGFVVVFVLRVFYGYFAYPDTAQNIRFQNQPINWESIVNRKNYASKKFTLETSVKGTTTTVDQKYEKIGTLSSETSDFEHDEQQLRTIIQEHNMLIQFEQRSGLTGMRILHMALGVIPDKFEQMITKMKKIGILTFIQINKSDKTNEYKELEAKKISLEKTRKALSELKGLGGSVKELIQLENRILDIEHQIQAFGVSLGEFDEENEFCTVKFTLLETRIQSKIPFSQRLKVAFEWTVKYYFVFILTMFIGTLSVFLILISIQKVRWLQQQIGNIISKGKILLQEDE